MTTDIEPFVTTADALQHVFEALSKMAAALPERDRQNVEQTLQRIRRSRTELTWWVEEHR